MSVIDLDEIVVSPFECPLCFERYNAGTNLPATLPCGHSFCLSHMRQMDSCPICRYELPSRSVKSLNPSYSLRDGALLYFGILDAKMDSNLLDSVMDKIRNVRLEDEALKIEQNNKKFEKLKKEEESRRRKQIMSDEELARKLAAEWDSRVPPVQASLVRQNSGRGNTIKVCGHKCSLSQAVRKCCACGDIRPILREGTYPAYKDGVGWCDSDNRNSGYCPTCKLSSNNSSSQ